MPFELKDLMAPGMDKKVKTIESPVRQPAIPQKEETPKVAKKTTVKPKKKQNKEVSVMVQKAKDVLVVLCMGLLGVFAIALLIRAIQFLFSI